MVQHLCSQMFWHDDAVAFVIVLVAYDKLVVAVQAKLVGNLLVVAVQGRLLLLFE